MYSKLQLKHVIITRIIFIFLASNCYACHIEEHTDPITHCSIFLDDNPQRKIVVTTHQIDWHTVVLLKPNEVDIQCIGENHYASYRNKLSDLLLILGVLSSHQKDYPIILEPIGLSRKEIKSAHEYDRAIISQCIALLKGQIESLCQYKLPDCILYHPCQLPKKVINDRSSLKSIQAFLIAELGQTIPKELAVMLELESMNRRKLLLISISVSSFRKAPIPNSMSLGVYMPLYSRFAISTESSTLEEQDHLETIKLIRNFFCASPHNELPACKEIAHYLGKSIHKWTCDPSEQEEWPSWASKVIGLEEILGIIDGLELTQNYYFSPNFVNIGLKTPGSRYAHIIKWSLDCVEQQCMNIAINSEKQNQHHAKIQNLNVTKAFIEQLLKYKYEIPGFYPFAQRIISSCELQLEKSRQEGSSDVDKHRVFMLAQDIKWSTLDGSNILDELRNDCQYTCSVRQLLRGAFMDMLNTKIYSEENIATISAFIFAILNKDQQSIATYIARFRGTYKKGPRTSFCENGIQEIQEIWDKYSEDALQPIVHSFRLGEEGFEYINDLIMHEVRRLLSEYRLAQSRIYQ